MDVLVLRVYSDEGADKHSTIFACLHLRSLYFSLRQLSESTSIPWFLPSPLFFSILSRMSLLDYGLVLDLGSRPYKANVPRIWRSLDLGMGLQYACHAHFLPHVTRDTSRKHQTTSLSVGLLKSAARRPIAIHDFRREGLIKVDCKLPILLDCSWLSTVEILAIRPLS